MESKLHSVPGTGWRLPATQPASHAGGASGLRTRRPSPTTAQHDYELTRQRFASPAAASRYATRHGAKDWRNRRELALILHAFSDLPAGSQVLDLPCGAGRAAIALAGQGYAVEAADAAADMVEVTRRIAAEHGVGSIQFSVRDVLATGLPDGVFDAVLCNRLLHHYRSAGLRTQVLRELRRVSRGPIVAFYFLRTPLSWLSFDLKNRIKGKRPADRIPITRGQLEAEAAAAGLRVRSILRVRALLSPQCYVILDPLDE
ncbi:MAG: class I SAM-dependent methyltransferase [Chromatiales bacterium]|nr:class I SAM-dependent methyltransferase [Chromatiales bacterium]